jgi:hypothetical protein
MNLLRIWRTVRAVGTAIAIVGDLLVILGKTLRGSNLEPVESDLEGQQDHLQDPLTHGVVNEKPEEVQSEFFNEDDSMESNR